jgi:hypothetical protein
MNVFSYETFNKVILEFHFGFKTEEKSKLFDMTQTILLLLDSSKNY